jgi:hypothetical protein
LLARMCYCSVSGSRPALFLLIITSAYSSPSLSLQTKFYERRCLIVLIRRSFQHQPLKNNNIIIRGEHFFLGRERDRERERERERERGVGNNAWLGRGKREREKRTIGVVLSLHPKIVNSLVAEDRYSWRKSSNVRVLSLMAVLVVVAIEELQRQRETLSSLFSPT